MSVVGPRQPGSFVGSVDTGGDAAVVDVVVLAGVVVDVVVLDGVVVDVVVLEWSPAS